MAHDRSSVQRYRLDLEGFNELLDIIRPDLEPSNPAQAKRAKWGYEVQTEAKLAMALRYLAGSSSLDLQLIYMVSNSYVYARDERNCGATDTNGLERAR